ncbi:MAG: (deoxy)nucleoside triphosphate pyrophosphohydrolase [Gammaproteobacteria bacterium]|nr:(deoxy)nucleoside triphosphate pyrophosphohydrolase [Gammaproteobacteria bacterium]MDH3450575.1 (deoxy)nucleoside triphosphate pyrophosphohydrolase [Gammaproteobacteria bacterium]
MRNTEADSPVINPVSIAENYIHVVAAIIWRRNTAQSFLIAQRQKGKHLQDYWELPGGKLEAGESPWPALQREIIEEVDIRAISGSPYMRVYHRYPDRNILLDTWTIDEYEGEARPREQQALHWVGVDEIDQFRFPPADIPILDAIKRSAIAGN